MFKQGQKFLIQKKDLPPMLKIWSNEYLEVTPCYEVKLLTRHILVTIVGTNRQTWVRPDTLRTVKYYPNTNIFKRIFINDIHVETPTHIGVLV